MFGDTFLEKKITINFKNSQIYFLNLKTIMYLAGETESLIQGDVNFVIAHFTNFHFYASFVL